MIKVLGWAEDSSQKILILLRILSNRSKTVMPLIPSRFQVKPFLDVSQHISHTPTPSTKFSQNLVRQPSSVSIILSVQYFFRYFTTLWTIKILFRITLCWAEESSLHPTHRGPSPPPQMNNPIGTSLQSLLDRSTEQSQAPE